MTTFDAKALDALGLYLAACAEHSGTRKALAAVGGQQTGRWVGALARASADEARAREALEIELERLGFVPGHGDRRLLRLPGIGSALLVERTGPPKPPNAGATVRVSVVPLEVMEFPEQTATGGGPVNYQPKRRPVKDSPQASVPLLPDEHWYEDHGKPAGGRSAAETAAARRAGDGAPTILWRRLTGYNTYMEGHAFSKAEPLQEPGCPPPVRGKWLPDAQFDALMEAARSPRGIEPDADQTAHVLLREAAKREEALRAELVDVRATLDTERECREVADRYIYTLGEYAQGRGDGYPIGGFAKTARDEIERLRVRCEQLERLHKSAHDDAMQSMNKCDAARDEIERLAAFIQTIPGEPLEGSAVDCAIRLLQGARNPPPAEEPRGRVMDRVADVGNQPCPSCGVRLTTQDGVGVYIPAKIVPLHPDVGSARSRAHERLVAFLYVLTVD